MKENQMTLFGEMPAMQKPLSIRETVARYGSESVGVKELMAMLVGLDVQKLNLLLNGEEVYQLFNKALPELELITTRSVASKIFALSEIIKRQRCFQAKVKPIVNSPSDVKDLLMGEMRFLDQEEFRIILLGTKNQVLRVETISIGTLNSSLVHPREVFRAALKNATSSVILVHNHPSGDPTPSHEDIEVTKKLIQGGEILGIKIMDHIILGDGRYVSLKEKNMID